MASSPMMLGYMMPSPRPARHLLSSTCHSEELSAASTMPARKGSVDTCGDAEIHGYHV